MESDIKRQHSLPLTYAWPNRLYLLDLPYLLLVSGFKHNRYHAKLALFTFKYKIQKKKKINMKTK